MSVQERVGPRKRSVPLSMFTTLTPGDDEVSADSSGVKPCATRPHLAVLWGKVHPTQPYEVCSAMNFSTPTGALQTRKHCRQHASGAATITTRSRSADRERYMWPRPYHSCKPQ